MNRLMRCAHVSLAVLTVVFGPAALGATTDTAVLPVLTAARSGSGAGTVVADSGAINCGATCSDSYATGTVITLTATAAAGSQFTGWLGPCTGRGSCTFTMGSTTTATATFTPSLLNGQTLDVDGNGSCDALTDGLLTLRYLFGLTGSPVVSGAIAAGATRTTPTQVQDYLIDRRPMLDIDGDGSTDALTDGLLILRYQFGLTGASLISGVVGAGATRATAAAIESQLAPMCTSLPTYALTVNTAGTGTGSVSSAPAGIDCNLDCTENYPATNLVTLTAAPEFGTTFTGWSGGGCSGTDPCVVTMNAASAVTATFTPTVCDSGLATNSSTGLDYGRALELCQTTTEAGSTPGLISATLTLASGTGTPAVVSRAIRPAYGSANSPRAGSAMVVLSTGSAAAATDAGYQSADPGVDTGTSSALPADWLAAHGGNIPNLPSCVPIASATAYNPVMLTLRIRVPPKAHAFELSANFFSPDFPEYICSTYNDVFVALLDSSYAGTPANPADKNLASDYLGLPLNVNLAIDGSGLFTQCVNGNTGCLTLTPGTVTSCTGTAGLAGTGLDVAKPGACDATSLSGGATGWMKIRGNVVPGEVITLRLALWDSADQGNDSTVLLDRFKFLPANVTPGMVAAP